MSIILCVRVAAGINRGSSVGSSTQLPLSSRLMTSDLKNVYLFNSCLQDYVEQDTDVEIWTRLHQAQKLHISHRIS